MITERFHKVLIRPLKLSDAEKSWQWRNDPEIWKYTGSRPKTAISPEIERKWLEKVVAEKDSRRFAILVNDVYVGNVQLTEIIANQNAQFHIFIGDKKYWSRGVAKRAIEQILFFAKEILFLKSVYLEVQKKHVGAIKLYNKYFSLYEETQDSLLMKIELESLEKPEVSVFVLSYNHGKYIQDCLEGILMQRCNFSFEIVIGEDFSTDDTRAKILDYANLYPGKFKLLLHSKNLGAKKNQALTYQACSGKYIAVCEGDDYWTEPFKLQKQFDYLEINQDCSMVFHAAEHKNEITGEVKIDSPKRIKKNHKFEMKHAILGGGDFITTNAIFFRSKYIKNIPKWVLDAPVGDWPLTLLLASYGKIAYLHENMSCYRIMAEGSWSLKIKNDPQMDILFKTEMLKMWNEFDIWSDYKYRIYSKKMVYKMMKKKKKKKLKEFIMKIFTCFCSKKKQG